MPQYTFLDTKTNETFDLEMKIAEREEYLAKNPHIKQQIVSINIGDAVRLGVTKPPADFAKNVLGRIKHQHPKGNVERTHTIPREW
jgi:hypothetical protein